MHFLILIAVLVAKGRVLRTKCQIFVIFHIIVKQYAIKRLKYSPEINKILEMQCQGIEIVDGRLLAECWGDS